jgi:hypothetical protein
MKSKNRSDLLDFERDVPTSESDILALRRARTLTQMDLRAYIKFLESFGSLPASQLRSKRGPVGPEPFEL